MTLKIALVHDLMINTGGAERVLSFMHECFPEAPIYTSVYFPNQTFFNFCTAQVKTLPGSWLANTEVRAKQLYPLWMLGFARLRLDEYDVVLTSTTSVAKFVRPSRSTLNLSYCYAPTRFLWQPQVYTASSLPIGHRWSWLVQLMRPALRHLDYQAMQNPARLATTCLNAAAQIWQNYDRIAQVIYAPIRTHDYFSSENSGDYYLMVGRLISHKRVDLAIQACHALKRKLVVVGEGPERAVLEAMADERVHFVGRASDDETRCYFANCRAVLFPSDEDFGLVPIEAQAAGRPVVAYKAGGALETVVEGKSGVFFEAQTVDSMIEAIQKIEAHSWESALIKRQVERFDVANFKRNLVNFVTSL